MTNFEEIAKASAKWRKDNIKIIPDECKINPKYLGSITNDEFISVFKEMQELILSIYDDVEKVPLEWGYPSENNTKNVGGTAYDRISDFFKGLIENGVISDNLLVVNAKTIPKCYDDKASFRIAVNKHSKIEFIMEKLKCFGFVFDEYDKKAESFMVSYPGNPLILNIMQIYARAIDYESYHIGAGDTKFGSFSYRWVEDPNEQKHEPIFLVKMDMSSKELQDIGYWLYDKAKEYGFSIDKKKPFDKGCFYYTKGSKSFLLVGDWSGHNESGNCIVRSKAIFRKVFETNPDEIIELANRKPDAFGNRESLCNLCNGYGGKAFDKPCSMRITYEIGSNKYNSCAFRSFYFLNPTLDDMKLILKLYMIENKIK